MNKECVVKKVCVYFEHKYEGRCLFAGRSWSCKLMPHSPGRRDVLSVKVLRYQRKGFGRTLCEGNFKKLQ